MKFENDGYKQQVFSQKGFRDLTYNKLRVQQQ